MTATLCLNELGELSHFGLVPDMQWVVPYLGTLYMLHFENRGIDKNRIELQISLQFQVFW